MTAEYQTEARVSERAAKRPRASLSRPIRPTLAIALCLLLAVAGYYAWRTWFSSGSAEKGVLTTPVVRGDLEDAVTATGTLQPKNFVDVGTQISGQLRKLHVELGAIVKAGDLLAEIDSSVYLSKVDADRAQLQNQQAQLADRMAQLALAQAQYTRQRNLAREEATSKEALQSAEQAATSARAQVAAIKAQMQQTRSTLRGDEANLGYTKIYAPISGTVVSQAAKQGQTLNANQSAPIVMRIADLSTMTVQAQVSEADVAKLKVGMDVYFTTLAGDNRRYYGTLRQIPPTPTVTNNVVLYDALFDVPNPRQELMTQMTAQVFFVIVSAKDVVQVPITALRPVRGGRDEGRSGGKGEHKTEGKRDGERRGSRNAAAGGAEGTALVDPRRLYATGRATVRVVADTGEIQEREVKVGVMNRVSAQILSGLEPGEKVVIGTRAAKAGAAASKAQQPAHPPLIPTAPTGRR